LVDMSPKPSFGPMLTTYMMTSNLRPKSALNFQTNFPANNLRMAQDHGVPQSNLIDSEPSILGSYPQPITNSWYGKTPESNSQN